MTHQATYCVLPQEKLVFDAVNRARQLAGLPVLASSHALGAAARHQAEDMAANNVLRHGLADGTRYGANIRAHGYNFSTYTAETVHAGFADPEAAAKAFLGSPSHRLILLSTRYKAMGVGHAYRKESTYDHWWAIEFGGRIDTPARPC